MKRALGLFLLALLTSPLWSACTTYLPMDSWGPNDPNFLQPRHDCYVNQLDLFRFASDWLKCTYIYPGSATVDGNLSEWTGATWFPMTIPYDQASLIILPGLANAAFALRYDSTYVYVAVKYQDPTAGFQNSYLGWNGQDGIELYMNAGNWDQEYGPFGFPAETNYAHGQQFIIGKKIATSTTWQSWGDAQGVTQDILSSAVTTGADNWIYFEARIKPYALYDRPTNGGTLAAMTPGTKIGFDLCAVDRGTSGYLGMVSENPRHGKHMNERDSVYTGARALTVFTLAASTDTCVCGTYLPNDKTGPAGTPDARIDLYDFAMLSAQWLDCTDTTNAICRAWPRP